MKKGIRIGGIISIIVILAGSIHTSIMSGKSINEDLDLECYGIVEDIRISDNHGTPYFLINSDWKYLGMYGYSIRANIQPGDSVAKEKGKKSLLLFRKMNGRFHLIQEVEL